MPKSIAGLAVEAVEIIFGSSGAGVAEYRQNDHLQFVSFQSMIRVLNFE